MVLTCGWANKTQNVTKKLPRFSSAKRARNLRIRAYRHMQLIAFSKTASVFKKFACELQNLVKNARHLSNYHTRHPKSVASTPVYKHTRRWYIMLRQKTKTQGLVTTHSSPASHLWQSWLFFLRDERKNKKRSTAQNDDGRGARGGWRTGVWSNFVAACSRSV